MTGKEIENLVIVKLEEYTPFSPTADGAAPILSGGDSLSEIKPIYSYVNQTLPQAANEALRMMPIHLLQYRDCLFAATPNTADNKIGTIALPVDFLRLHTLRMSDWERPAHNAVYPYSPLYNRQFVRSTRGNFCKPVVTIDGDNNGDVDNRIVSAVMSGRYYVGDDCEQAATDFFSGSQNDTIFVTQSLSNPEYIKVWSYTTSLQSEDFEANVLHYYAVNKSHGVARFSFVPMFRMADDYGRDVAECIALNCARKVCQIFGYNEQAELFTSEMNLLLSNTQI